MKCMVVLTFGPDFDEMPWLQSREKQNQDSFNYINHIATGNSRVVTLSYNYPL